MDDNTIRLIKAKTRADQLMFLAFMGWLLIIIAGAGLGLYMRWDKILLAGQ